MKTTKFKSIVIKVKSRGTSFIHVPIDFAKKFYEKEEIKVTIDNRINFFSNVRVWKGIGFYVPSDIALKFNLFNKKVNVSLEKIDGFHAKILYDGRVYISNNIAEKNKLIQNDIIFLECKTKDKILREYCRIHSRNKKNTIEHFCMFTRKRSQIIEGIFKILKVYPHEKMRILNGKLKDIFTFDNVAEIGNTSIIIFHGNRVPLVINSQIRLEDFSCYLGCYFADGTKKGNSWGICASTFEQARYYKEMHEKLIRDAKIVYNISYSDPKNKNKEILKNNLRKLWQKKTGIKLKDVRVSIYPTQYNAPNRNLYGTLIFRENRELTRIYYVRLLKFLLNKIKKEKNQKLALEFILGVLEGDGSPGAPGRGHVMIATNLEDSQILNEILNSTKMKFKIRKEGENKYSIHIGSLEIIKNIPILKDKLFKYYPKRRKILKERLAQTGCARFLLGKSKKTSNWLIGQLNMYGILDGKGNLTKFGEEIKKNLNEFLKTE